MGGRRLHLERRRAGGSKEVLCVSVRLGASGTALHRSRAGGCFAFWRHRGVGVRASKGASGAMDFAGITRFFEEFVNLLCDPGRAAAHAVPPLRDAGGAGLGLIVVERKYARDEVLIQESAARV